MSRGRQAVRLSPPPVAAEELSGFPRKPLGPDVELFRVVRSGRCPWWFGSTGAGRFDLGPPEGTCYLARDEIGALLEVVGGTGRSGGGVDEGFLAARQLFRSRVPAAHELADLTHRRAAGFGVTAEIGTVTPYDLPRAWAARLREAGVGGLAYWLRHDPARSGGVALFGPAGERRDWPPGDPEPIGDPLKRRLEAECGLRILSRPRLADLRLADDGPPGS